MRKPTDKANIPYKLIAQFPGARHYNLKEIKAVESVLKSQSPYRFEGIKKGNFVKI